MKIKRLESSVVASAYTTDTVRRQFNVIQAKYKDLTSIQTKLLASNRLTASFTQNSMRDLLELVAPTPVIYTTARLLTAVKVAGKEPKEKKEKKAPAKTAADKAKPKTSDADAIKKLMEQSDPLTQAMSKKPESTGKSTTPKAPKKTQPKLTIAEVLNLVENFANTHAEAGDEETAAEEIDSARTRAESLRLGELSPKLVELQRGILERLGSVKSKGKLETFLATESEKLRTALKNFESEQSPAESKAKDPETIVYDKNKFLDVLADIEIAEDDAAESGAKITSFKVLLQNSFEELYQEVFNFDKGEVKDIITRTKEAVENSGNVKAAIAESKNGRKLLKNYVANEEVQGRLKDSGRQEPTQVEEKAPDTEAARKELENFNKVITSAPKTIPKTFLSSKIYPILDKIVSHVPGLESIAKFFREELEKQEKPTTKILQSFGTNLVNSMNDYLAEPEPDNEEVPAEDPSDFSVDDEIAEDTNDFTSDEAEPAAGGFEFQDETAEPSAAPAPAKGKTGFEMDEEETPPSKPAATTEAKKPRKFVDDEPEAEETPAVTSVPETPATPPKASAPTPAATPVPAILETPKPKTRQPRVAPAAPQVPVTRTEPVTTKQTTSTPPLTEQQAIKPVPGQFDVSGQDGDLKMKQTSIKLDPANKQLIQKHQAVAKDLNTLFYELQTISARINTSLVDSVAPKTIAAIQSSLGRLGEQVKISMLASLKAIREMTAAHIPKPFADTAKNLLNLVTKTIPTKIPPVIHTFMFIDEDDELCFSSFIVLTRPTDKQGRTIPRLFIYLTYRTQKHKMYVATSRNMLPLSEDLFRMPFSNPKTMAIGLDRLLMLDNFHANLSKVDLATVFGKAGVDSAKIINDFPGISSLEQDGDELVFALSDSIDQTQEAMVERHASQLENRFKLSIGKKFRIFKSYKFVNTAIEPDDVYSDSQDNKTAEPKTVNKPTPHFEIRFSFTAVPGQEPISEADLSFLKDRFIKLNDESIRRMVRVANSS